MKKKLPGAIAAFVFAVIVACASLLPFAWVIVTSLKGADQIYDVGQTIPTRITLQNYSRVIVNESLLRYFANSTLVALVTTVLCIVVSVMAAYGLCRYNILGARKIRVAILYIRMFPSILLAIPYYTMMRSLGLLDTLVGLILIYSSFTLPFCLWNMWAFFSVFPWEIEEAAIVDGAGLLRCVWHVVLPIARIGILATGMFAFIAAWDEYMYANLFITATAKKTIMLGVYSFIGEYTTDWGGLMAAATISFIPVVVFFAFLQKNMVQGITAGSIKG